MLLVFPNLEHQCEILPKAWIFLRDYHNHSLDSGFIWASRYSCRQTQFKAAKAGNMNIRLNRKPEDIAEYPRESWGRSGSVALFQRMHLYINLHFLCDLLWFVFGKTRALISTRKPSKMNEFHLVFFSLPSMKYFQGITKYETIASFNMIDCHYFIGKFISQTLEQDFSNKPRKKDTWLVRPSYSARWMIQCKTEVSSLM
jgi:hypothetical protein